MEAMFIVFFDKKSNKFSILSPTVNALIPSFAIFNGVTIQFFFGMAGMKGWAKGNVPLIVI